MKPQNKRTRQLQQQSSAPGTRKGSFFSSLKRPLDSFEKPQVILPDQKIYKALLFREYVGPGISPERFKHYQFSTQLNPVYLGPDGTIYNLNYEPISTPEDESSSSSSSSSSFSFSEKSGIFKRFPQSDSFKTYADYERGILQWKSEAETTLQGLRLPVPLGRYFFRPHAGVAELGGEEGRSDSSDKSDDPIGASGGKGTPNTPKGHEMRSALAAKSFEDSESVSTEADLDDSDIFEKKWNIDTDPWQSLLIPPEPDTALYNEFEDYERAMANWALACHNVVKTFPPHPSQFSSLLFLSPAEKRRKEQQEKMNKRRTNDQRKMELGKSVLNEQQTVKPIFIPLDEGDEPTGFVKGSQVVKTHFNPDDFERDYSIGEQTLYNVQDMFHRIADVRSANKKQFGTPCEPFTFEPIYTFDRPMLDGGSEIHPSAGKPEAFGRPLFRLDRDFPRSRPNDKKHGRPGQLSPYCTPFGLRNLKMSRLKQADYQKLLKATLREIDNLNRFDHLNSWYHPTVSLKTTEKLERDIKFQLSTQVNFTLDSIYYAISSPMYLDHFRHFLMSTIHGDETYFDKFLALLNTVEDLNHILSWFKLFDDELFQAKLATLVIQVIETKGNTLFADVLAAKDMVLVSKLSKALAYFSNPPIEVYPYTTEISELVKKYLPDDLDIIRDILSEYYVATMTAVLESRCENGTTFTISKQALEEARISLGKKIEANPKEIIAYLINLTKHRLCSVSALGLTALLRLLTSPSSFLMDSVRRISKDVITSLRELARSKFSHVQFAAGQLFNVITSKRWIECYSEYYKEGDTFEQDLLLNFRGKPLYLANLTAQIAERTLGEMLASENPKGVALKHSYIVKPDNSLTRALLAKISHIDPEGQFQISVNITRIVRLIFKVSFRIDYAKFKTGDPMNQFFSTSIDEVTQITQRLSELRGESTITYQVKTNLLNVLRIQTKRLNIAEVLNHDKNFLTQVARYCRDSQNFDFTAAAWHFLYNLIKYHNGCITILDNTKLINQFMEAISPGVSASVFSNAFWYITKVIKLPEREFERPLQGFLTSRLEIDSKSIEKDVKQFTVSLLKHVAKWHMIYRRMQDLKTEGKPFFYVVHFIYDIVKMHKSTAGGTKLYKELTKSETYRDNVQMVFALFNEEIKISSSDSALKRLHSGLSEDRNSRTSILFRNKTSA